MATVTTFGAEHCLVNKKREIFATLYKIKRSSDEWTSLKAAEPMSQVATGRYFL